MAEVMEKDRLFHAYIICGEDKEALDLALFIAKGANCLAVSGRPCGECSSCGKVDSSNHPDVSITDPEGAVIGIDDIRRLQRAVFVKPYEGRKKVSIIRQGERMTVQAQNCLLKILEEPPGVGVIVITAMNRANMLPTILSRCQILKPYYEKNVPDFKLYEDILKCFLKGDFNRASTEISLLIKDDGRSVEDFLDFLFLQLRDILTFKVAQKEDLLYIKDNGDFVRRAATAYTLDKLGRMLDAVSEARESLRFNVNAQLAMEVLVLEIQEV